MGDDPKESSLTWGLTVAVVIFTLVALFFVLFVPDSPLSPLPGPSPSTR